MLEEALSTAADLRRALEAEVERARREPGALRTLDSARLFASASARAAFHDEVARLESALAARLARAGAALGLAEVTLAGLTSRAPAAGSALAALLARIRALAAELKDLDRLNRALAGRASACVQGYLNALAPAPAAYDRRGARASGASRSAVSRKA